MSENLTQKAKEAFSQKKNKCENCGTDNPEKSKFCSECGAPLSK